MRAADCCWALAAGAERMRCPAVDPRPFVLAAQVRAADFFLGYRRVALAPHEVLLAVSVPFTRRHEYVREFKQAHRRDDDIAIVNAGMRARMRRTLAGARGISYFFKI